METFSISNIESFNFYFKTQDDCLNFLAKLKWKNGYQCRRCSCKKYIKGRLELDRRCVRCYYNESPTSQTIFHHIKFPLLKAFYICFRMSVSKKGVSSMELSRELGLRQKTCWAFRRKVQQAMSFVSTDPLRGILLSKDFHLRLRRPAKCSRGSKPKKSVVLYMEKPCRDKSSKLQIKVAPGYLIEKPANFHINHSLNTKFSHACFKHHKDSDSRILKLMVFNLKSWLRGIHHTSSTTHIQCYLNEFSFRFNGRSRIPELFEVLLEHMIHSPPLVISKGEHCA